MNSQLLIHAGYHKTGTSYLQKFIFGNSSHGFCTPVGRHELRRIFVQADSFEFEAVSVRAALQTQIDQAFLSRQVPVLTHEQFSGQPAGGGYGLRRREREASRREVADRLYAVFPDARVLIIIREQREMIRYLEYYWSQIQSPFLGD